jgi:hypothetical protein
VEVTKNVRKKCEHENICSFHKHILSSIMCLEDKKRESHQGPTRRCLRIGKTDANQTFQTRD